MKALLWTLAFIPYALSAQQKSWLPNYDTLVGREYVPFELKTIDSKVFSNESCKGKVVFLNFWFESCLGCRQEFAELNELYDSLRNDDKCVFLSVTYDEEKNLPEFVASNNLIYPIATTNNHTLFKKLNYHMGCPGMIILDKQGKIALIGMKAVIKSGTPNKLSITVAEAINMIRQLY